MTAEMSTNFFPWSIDAIIVTLVDNVKAEFTVLLLEGYESVPGLQGHRHFDLLVFSQHGDADGITYFITVDARQ